MSTTEDAPREEVPDLFGNYIREIENCDEPTIAISNLPEIQITVVIDGE